MIFVRVGTQVLETWSELLKLELILDRAVDHAFDRLIVDICQARRLPVRRTSVPRDARSDALAIIVRLDEMRSETEFQLERAQEIERLAALHLRQGDLERRG